MAMLTRKLFDQILGRLKIGGVLVHYWDGTTKKYGPSEPYFEMTIKHPAVIRAILRNPTLGFGEAYMAGRLEVAGEIYQVGRLIAENEATFAALSRFALPRRGQPNRRGQQRRQIAHHYDLGNDFYKLWLDDSLTYSCAYFKQANDKLEQAQDQKVDHILRKLQLQPGQALLDIGCGWGKLLIAAAQQYGVTGYGITLSEQQYELARQRVKAAGLSDRVTIELINYQDLARRALTFDRIVSVGMYEHVGRGNHTTYFWAIDKLLARGGLSVLHTITSPTDEPTDAWNDKYIFPGGFIPSAGSTLKLMEGQHFELQDYENLRYHYALTLEEWLRRFEAHEVEVMAKYGEQFYRMWRLYLGSSVSGFRYGPLGLSQFVFTRRAQPGLPLTRAHLYSKA